MADGSKTNHDAAKAARKTLQAARSEQHRLEGIKRLKAAVGAGATKVLRIPITNVYDGSDYSAEIKIGAGGAVANVILDTGSSTLAVDPSVYNGKGDGDLKATSLAQLVGYGTGGWAGPVVTTDLDLGGGAAAVDLKGCSVAIATVQQPGNFEGVKGILGLAYNGLNSAFDFSTYFAKHGMANTTYPWPFGTQPWEVFTSRFARLVKTNAVPQTDVVPYFDQLEDNGVVANKFAFYTLRSWASLAKGTDTASMASDPLNNGFFVLGGGEEQNDLYTGDFVNVDVLHDLYYNTNLKSVRVAGCAAVAAAPLQAQYQQYMISNSIVDSGTSDLSLAGDVYNAILAGLKQVNPVFAQAAQAAQTAMQSNQGVPTDSLKLADWPNIYFTLTGENGEDVELCCTPQTYWQVDFPAAGQAAFQISGPLDDANQSILGLPLLNNYYTVFDRTQDAQGVVRFAAIKPPA